MIRVLGSVAASAVCMLTLWAEPLRATPLDEARARVIESFTQRARIPVDPALVEGPWEPVPFDQARFTYSFDEIRQRWPEFMRGLRIPYPSPEYLADRYNRFPDMMRDLGYQDDDWEQHSLNVLEVWQAFFRGDFRKARDLGIKYGGYAQVPGLFAQILQAIYLAKSHEQKQMLLQDAIDRIEYYGKATPFLPHESEFHQDYVIFRLGLAYAVGRLAEDEPVPVMLANGYAPLVANAGAEAQAVDPNHPMVLALNAVFDANVIRRVGKAAGRWTLGAQEATAADLLGMSLGEVDDVAITQYEYANSLLYMQDVAAIDEALRHLQTAAQLDARFSMELLDVMYAQKRLQEVQALKARGGGFSGFDRARRRHMKSTGVNLYCVTCPAFLIN